MEPFREDFWNIQLGQIVYALALGAGVLLAYGLYQRLNRWKIGKPDNRFDQLRKRLGTLASVGVAELLGHTRLLRDRSAGIMHLLLFWGFLGLFIATSLDAINYYLFHFLRGGTYLAFSLFADSSGIALFIGVALAAYRRYVQKPKKLDNALQDGIALLLIVLTVLTGFVVEGLRLGATELQENPGWAVWSPGGWLTGKALLGLPNDTLRQLHIAVWWFHSILALGVIAYVPLTFTKLSHIVLAPANLFFRSLRPKGALLPIAIEQAETFGAGKIEDFTWKHLFDLDCCTRCGRCTDHCPAHTSGKPLSPMKLIQDLRKSFEKAGKPLLEGEKPRTPLVDKVIADDELWACTTCRACQEQCPVYIEHLDKIVDLRRNAVLEQARFPATAMMAVKCIAERGHPWRGTTLSRTDWTGGLEIKSLSENSNIEVLYWVGCASALEERSTKIAIAIAKILQQAGISFGILGAEESCCGDPARRIGDEYVFQVQAKRNIETLNRYGVKRIITGCPHCYNTLKNEYPDFGGHFEVMHHTEFMAGLFRNGKLKATKELNKKVTYHDPCYLGRYNEVFAPPRKVLTSLPGLRVAEMERRQWQSFCCGAGGGRMWMEEEPNKRVSHIRVQQGVATKAETIVTACPYCLNMLQDAIKSLEIEESLKLQDIAELVQLAL